jgi:hypothetical protein
MELFAKEVMPRFQEAPERERVPAPA